MSKVLVDSTSRRILVDSLTRKVLVQPGCADTITVTFHDVIMDCGCLPWSQFQPQSFIVTDEGNFNDIPITLFLENCGPSIAGECYYDPKAACSEFSVHLQFWDVVNTTCSGPPTFDGSRGWCDFRGPEITIGQSGGLWYVEAGIGSSLFFYGTASDISLPIANTVGCNPSFSNFTLLNCPGTATASLNQSGHGGTATITIP